MYNELFLIWCMFDYSMDWRQIQCKQKSIIWSNHLIAKFDVIPYNYLRFLLLLLRRRLFLFVWLITNIDEKEKKKDDNENRTRHRWKRNHWSEESASEEKTKEIFSYVFRCIQHTHTLAYSLPTMIIEDYWSMKSNPAQDEICVMIIYL